MWRRAPRCGTPLIAASCAAVGDGACRRQVAAASSHRAGPRARTVAGNYAPAAGGQSALGADEQGSLRAPTIQSPAQRDDSLARGYHVRPARPLRFRSTAPPGIVVAVPQLALRHETSATPHERRRFCSTRSQSRLEPCPGSADQVCTRVRTAVAHDFVPGAARYEPRPYALVRRWRAAASASAPERTIRRPWRTMFPPAQQIARCESLSRIVSKFGNAYVPPPRRPARIRGAPDVTGVVAWNCVCVCQRRSSSSAKSRRRRR